MFNSLIAYKYNDSETDFNKINKQIKNKDFLFKKLTGFETYARGFDSFFDDTFIIESDNRILLKASFSSKTVSNKTVEALLDERVEQIKREKNETEVSDAVRRIYKEQIERECLKYIEPVTKSVFLLIDKYTKYIYVDTSSSNLAEDALHLLRAVVGKLVCRQVESLSASIMLTKFLSDPSNTHISETVSICDHPVLTAKDIEKTCSLKLDGLDRRMSSYIEMLEGLEIKSVDMKLVNALVSPDILVTFTLFIGKNNIFIFKKFKYEDTEISAPSSKKINDDYDDGSYYYTSKMLLVGRYMTLIMGSFNEFFGLENK